MGHGGLIRRFWRSERSLWVLEIAVIPANWSGAQPPLSSSRDINCMRNNFKSITCISVKMLNNA